MASCPICRSPDCTFLREVGGRELLICKACRHIFWAQMPEPHELAAYYGGAYGSTHQQLAAHQGVRDYYAQHAREFADRFGLTLCDASIADVGCSYPVFLEEAARAGYRQVLGVDWDEAARRHGETVGVRVVTPDAFEAEVAEGSLDVLRYSHSLEHMVDPAAVLQRQARKLRRGGIVYITQPSVPALRAEPLAASLRDCGWPNHLHYFSSTSLVEMVRGLGFEVVAFFTDHQAEAAAETFAVNMDAAYAAEALKSLHDSGEPIRGPLNNYPYYAGENSTLFARLL